MKREDFVSTPDLRSALMEIVENPDAVPTYRALADRIRDGLWPTVRLAGRPHTRKADLSLAARRLDLRLKSNKRTAA